MRRASCGALLLGPIVVFLVIGGVGFYLLSRSVREKLPDPTTTPVSTSSQETLVLTYANPRLPHDEVAALDLPSAQLRVLTPPATWRLSSFLREQLRLEELPIHDVYRVVRDDGWNVVLRTPNGNAYQDPVIVGLFDRDHAAILAHTDRRVLLSVSRFGGIHVVRVLDDQDSVRLVQDNYAWLVHFTPGEGIEDPHRGPSTLTRLTRLGSSTTVAESPGAIARVIPYEEDAQVFAYATEEGTFTAITGTSTWQGRGVPLVWRDPQTLLFTQGKTLYQRRAASSTAERITELVAIPSMAFVSSTKRQLW